MQHSSLTEAMVDLVCLSIFESVSVSVVQSAYSSDLSVCWSNWVSAGGSSNSIMQAFFVF